MDLDVRMPPEEVPKLDLYDLFPWLADCQYHGGTFYMTTTGRGKYLLYENGFWDSGTWLEGTMIDCEFYSGEMKRYSSFIGGTWHNGTFAGFEFKNSVWVDGIFKQGWFNNSKFMNGKFEYGVFDAMTGSKWVDGKWGEKAVMKYKDTIYDRVPAKVKLGKRLAKRLQKNMEANTDIDNEDNELEENSTNINTSKRGRGRPKNIQETDGEVETKRKPKKLLGFMIEEKDVSTVSVNSIPVGPIVATAKRGPKKRPVAKTKKILKMFL
jgi:hypothetical protein